MYGIDSDLAGVWGAKDSNGATTLSNAFELMNKVYGAAKDVAVYELVPVDKDGRRLT